MWQVMRERIKRVNAVILFGHTHTHTHTHTPDRHSYACLIYVVLRAESTACAPDHLLTENGRRKARRGCAARSIQRPSRRGRQGTRAIEPMHSSLSHRIISSSFWIGPLLVKGKHQRGIWRHRGPKSKGETQIEVTCDDDCDDADAFVLLAFCR